MKFAYLIEPPFNFIDASGSVTGHDIELARHIFQELGEIFEPIETEFAQLLPGITENSWQITTGMFVTKERQKNVIFTHPIWALPDGLLVTKGNPLNLSGYKSVTINSQVRLAVIRDQVQHHSAETFGIPKQRLKIFETYTEAATAVQNGTVDAYISVARAHSGFITENPDWKIEVVEVPQAEKPVTFGAFALAKTNTEVCSKINEILAQFLKTNKYRNLAKLYGFSDAEVEQIASI